MRVKIFDDQFAHTISCNDMPSKHIEWYRGGDNTPTCFFTGRSFGAAKNTNCKIKVGWLIEPRGIRPEIYSSNYLKDFDYMLTFDRQLIAECPEKILFYPFGCCWIPEYDRARYIGHKMVSMICSGKTQSEGHRFRNKLYDRYSTKFDGYGKYRNPIENKADALKNYMFSICVQNTKCDDYFTEILMDCFMTGTVPIFWGTNNIGKYFNADGIIQFDTEAELGKILNELSKDSYNSKMEAMADNYKKAQEYFSPEDYIVEHYPFLFEGMFTPEYA